jgi:Spy/CpxP family protein refolding chaperone
MKTKWMAGVLGAALAIGMPVFAQTAADSGQQNPRAQAAPNGYRHRHRMQKLTKELNLTPDQQTKIKPIFQQARAQAKTIHQDTTLNQDQKRAKMKELHENTMAQLNGILTPEQQTQLKQLQEQRRAQWQQRHQQQQQTAPQAAPGA